MASKNGKNSGSRPGGAKASGRKNGDRKATGFATDRKRVNRMGRILAIVLAVAMVMYFVIGASAFLQV